MRKFSLYITLLMIICLTIACNFDPSLLTGGIEKTTGKPPASQTAAVGLGNSTSTIEPTDVTEESLPTLTSTPDGRLDPCTLLTTEKAEAILGEPATAPENLSGSCVFYNAKDKLYVINIAAAQDKETSGILQGQAALILLSGNKVDNDFSTRVKSFSDEQDYKAFFSELVLAAKGSQTMTAKLYTGGGNDLTYWAWIDSPPRCQGDLVAVRQDTLVNINVVLPDTAQCSSLLSNLNALAREAFDKLPAQFSSGFSGQTSSSTSPAGDGVQATPTAIPVDAPSAPAATPTMVLAANGLPAPALDSPADGTVFDVYPRMTMLKWAPVEGASKYLVEIMACSASNNTTCFSHPMIEQTTRETVMTAYTFNFIGAQPGKWRVTAVDANGTMGTPSGWWTFTYTR